MCVRVSHTLSGNKQESQGVKVYTRQRRDQDQQATVPLHRNLSTSQAPLEAATDSAEATAPAMPCPPAETVTAPAVPPAAASASDHQVLPAAITPLSSEAPPSAREVSLGSTLSPSQQIFLNQVTMRISRVLPAPRVNKRRAKALRLAPILGVVGGLLAWLLIKDSWEFPDKKRGHESLGI
jgi:hypothetical protein